MSVPDGKAPFYEAPVFNEYAGYVSVLYSRLHIGSAKRFPEARRLTAEDIEALATRITPSERLNRTFCRPVNLRARTASRWPLRGLDWRARNPSD